MLYGLWSSAAGGIVQNAQVDQIAHNLANVETAGFRRHLMVYRSRTAETAEDFLDLNQINPVLDRIGGGLFADRTYWDTQQGAVTQTGRNLDVGIEGEGFFAVRKGEKTYYTRAGNFSVDSEGVLHTADGSGVILNRAGCEIRITQPLTASIDARGEVSQNGESVGALALVDFPDPEKLVAVGDTLFENRGQEQPVPATGKLSQGSLEQSGVNAVEEMTKMILAQRIYETNIQMMRIQDQTLERAVNDVGRIGR